MLDEEKTDSKRLYSDSAIQSMVKVFNSDFPTTNYNPLTDSQMENIYNSITSRNKYT